MRPVVELVLLACFVLPFLVGAAALLRNRVGPPSLADEQARLRKSLAAEWDALEPTLRAEGWSAENIAALKAEVFGGAGVASDARA